MSVIYFKEANHHYQTLDGTRYESVSGLWKPYAKPFDAQRISIGKAFQDLDLEVYNSVKKDLGYNNTGFVEECFNRTDLLEMDIIQQAKVYTDKWDKKRKLGTAFHAKMENMELDQGWALNPFDGKQYPVVKWGVAEGWDNQSCPVDLYKDIPDGYIPELLLRPSDHDSDYDTVLVAGQADRGFIETVGGVRYIDFDDYKTDDEIPIKPDFFHPKTGYQSMKPPFDHIYDTKFWMYSLKISTYAKFAESLGFTVRNLALSKVVIDEELNLLDRELMILPYKSFEVEICLKKYSEKFG